MTLKETHGMLKNSAPSPSGPLSPRVGSALSPGGPYTVDIRMQLSVGDTKASGSSTNVVAATALGGSSKVAALNNLPSTGSSLQNQSLNRLQHPSLGDGTPTTRQQHDETTSNFPTFHEMGSTAVNVSQQRQQASSYTLQSHEQHENTSGKGLMYNISDKTSPGWRGRRTREWSGDFQERSSQVTSENWASPRSADGDEPTSLHFQDQWSNRKALHLSAANQSCAPATLCSKRARVSKLLCHPRQDSGCLTTSPPTSPSQDESATNSSNMWESLFQRSHIMQSSKPGAFATGKQTEAGSTSTEGHRSIQLDATNVQMDLGDESMVAKIQAGEARNDLPASMTTCSEEHLKRFQEAQRNIELQQTNSGTIAGGGIRFESSPNNLLSDVITDTLRSRELPNQQIGSSSGYLGSTTYSAIDGWPQEGGSVTDYLLLTSAVHKANLLDLQIQENQRNLKQGILNCCSDEYMSGSRPTDTVDYQTGLRMGSNGVSLEENGSPFCYSSLSMLPGHEFSVTNDFFMDSRCNPGEQLTARAAYEKTRNEQRGDCLPSKRVFKRSSKGGPRRPHIIKGQWTPEEDRYV